MTQTQYKALVEKELRVLNEKIDLKILSGLGYSNEARRHRRLLAHARRIRRERQAGKFLSFFSFL